MDRFADLVDEQFCYLTTRGRVSGRPHRIEIWFALDEQMLYLLSGGRGRSDWVKNLRATPDVTVELRGRRFAGCARIVEDESEDERAGRSCTTSTHRATPATSHAGGAPPYPLRSIWARRPPRRKEAPHDVRLGSLAAGAASRGRPQIDLGVALDDQADRELNPFLLLGLRPPRRTSARRLADQRQEGRQRRRLATAPPGAR